MTDKVLVAKFSEAAARQAAGALEASGVSATAIRQQTGALAHEPSEQSAGDIWDWLLGEGARSATSRFGQAEVVPLPSPSLFPRQRLSPPRR